MKSNPTREMLRLLCNTDKSLNQIAGLTGKSWHTVKRYQLLIIEKSLVWEELAQLGEQALNQLFKPGVTQESAKAKPDWEYIHQLKQSHKHQTLRQLHYEHQSIFGEYALSYSQFTHHYREFVKSVDISMRQTWLPGDVCFVDFAGKRIPWTDSETGETHFAEIFVGVLGYSQLVFAIALPSQKSDDWLDAHVKMLSFFGGVPLSVVPDNLKSAVIKAGRFPELNRSYVELSEHYNFVIEPARVRRPQDKSLGEIGVLLVTRWITVVLRRRTFFSVDEINESITPLLEQLNQRPFKRYEGNRLSRFTEAECDKLKPLPANEYVIGQWQSRLKVDRDYHVYIQHHAYSVPYQYANKLVETKTTSNIVEIWHERKLIAIHSRSQVKGGATTDPEHRPMSHRKFAEQTQQVFVEWGSDIGDAVVEFVLKLFENKPMYSVSASRACGDLQKLARRYGAKRLCKACECAIDIGANNVTSVTSILQCRLDEDNQSIPTQTQLPLHSNVRGADYYANGRVSR